MTTSIKHAKREENARMEPIIPKNRTIIIEAVANGFVVRESSFDRPVAGAVLVFQSKATYVEAGRPPGLLEWLERHFDEPEKAT